MPTPLDTALAAARAGADAIASLGEFDTNTKAGPGDEVKSYNLVTAADLASEKAVLAAIRDAHPGHAIMSEESYAEDLAGGVPEHLWIVDPIDGTNNFAHGLPHWAVSVGYYRHGEAAAGVVYNPAIGELFRAERGGGAFVEKPAAPGAPDIVTERIAVSEAKRLDEVFVGTGFYYDRGQMMEATLDSIRDVFGHDIHGIRRCGTASLDLCFVACGRFGAYFEYKLHPWDFGAGRLIVAEAGGRVTDCRGAELPLAATHALASNGTLHGVMLETLAPHVGRAVGEA
ncbi:MAG: inositol monophosphatase family protein [Planctomycetota bacterium]